MMRHSPYKYYNRYFIPIFLLSLYNYSNLHKIPWLTKLKFQLIGYNLKTSAAFIRAFFLGVISFFQIPRVLRLHDRHWCFLFGFSKRTLYDVFIRYVSQTLPRALRVPLDVNFSVNDWYFTSLPLLHGLEIAFFEFFLYNKMFKSNLGNHLFFIPKKQTPVFAQRNYLRMYNLPIQYKIGN